MIELNLLPEEFRVKTVDKAEGSRIPFERIVLYCAIVLAVASVVLFIITSSFSLVLNGLKEKRKSLAPAIESVEKTKEALFEMESKIKSINELTSKRISWTGILRGINECIPPNIWMFNLSTSLLENKNTLIVEGFAMGGPEVGTTSVGKLIDSMKNNVFLDGEFSAIELDSIRQTMIEKQEVMQFRLVCVFKEPDAAKN